MSLRSLRVAVVGSGPAGVYAAAVLAERDASVDVIDRLPTPFGLVRYGVAPDHEKMKSVAVALRKVLEGTRVRFLGNVELGRDLSLDDLRRHYDAFIVASGAPPAGGWESRERMAALKENPAARRNLDILRDWSQRTPEGRPRRLHLRFLLRPIAIYGRTAVTGLELARGRLDGSGHAVDTGERLHLPATRQASASCGPTTPRSTAKLSTA